MKIGIISEGHADRAVITNILNGVIGKDEFIIEPLRPIYKLDETDKALIDPLTFGSWSLVKEECEKRELIDGFLAFEGQDFIVIHIDTAEVEHYGVKRPNKTSADYCKVLRELVVNQINTWLKKDLDAEILYAIAIEAIDAWILTIYDNKDSTSPPKPKDKLSKVLGKKGINSTSNYDNFLLISKALSKPREINKGKFLTYNCSLESFVNEVKRKVLPKLEREVLEVTPAGDAKL